jgi:hypothetical protein
LLLIEHNYALEEYYRGYRLEEYNALYNYRGVQVGRI